MNARGDKREKAYRSLNSKSIDELAMMGPEEVASAVYAPEVSLRLQVLAISAELQGKGMGTHLLKSIFDQFKEEAKVTFVSSDEKNRRRGR